MEIMNTNPLLFDNGQLRFGTVDEAIPFDRIRTEQFSPALNQALDLARANIARLKSLPMDQVSFESLGLGLETASEAVDIVAETYFNLLSAEADEARHALAGEISPKLAAFSNELHLDPELFRRYEALYAKRESFSLEQQKLLEKTYKAFVRNGARLDESKKARLREIDQELAQLGPKFSENVLKATYDFSLVLDREEDLSGLPQSAREAASAAARAKGLEGKWLLTLEAPSYVPFMTYSDRSDLREKLFRAQQGRCLGGAYDNQAILKRMAVLRHERAELLGFRTHADYVLQDRMAQSVEKVQAFLKRLLEVSKPVGQTEFEELRLFKASLGHGDVLNAWDTAYYSEKLKSQKFQFSSEELRPYFRLENVVAGVFEHAKRLYGIEFTPAPELPVYHPDVKVYRGFDKESGSLVGLFYCDFFPRPTKKGGAWMTALREQGLFAGELRRPHISIVCNFTKPTGETPSLLTLEEVRTLFHEFGHALHGLCSRVTYRSLAGTNVYWDFVELPSQIMENWVLEKEALDLFARHYKTNEALPESLIQKIKASSKFMAGSFNVRQIMLGLLDLAWHTESGKGAGDVEAFEDRSVSEARLIPRLPGTAVSPSFSHIFAGGYSAGYYSYKWAEVLDADAFELFRERGLFNPDVARSFRDNILSRGATEHPMELYKRFRGREPDPDAVLRRDGLLAESRA
jgi:peptidyl-dipeptidase Dcp